MPRPREFDTDAVLDAARDTFWRLGYETATLTDLTDAMGISRPSLYNAFGNKEALFLTVLDRYAAGYAPSLAAMEAEAEGREAVRSLLLAVAEGLSETRGCLRVGHTALAGGHVPPLADALTRAHRAFVSAFEDRLTRAQREGHLDADEDPAGLAVFFAGVVSAMAIESRVGSTEHVLRGIAERAMRVWR